MSNTNQNVQIQIVNANMQMQNTNQSVPSESGNQILHMQNTNQNNIHMQNVVSQTGNQNFLMEQTNQPSPIDFNGLSLANQSFMSNASNPSYNLLRNTWGSYSNPQTPITHDLPETSSVMNTPGCKSKVII